MCKDWAGRNIFKSRDQGTGVCWLCLGWQSKSWRGRGECVVAYKLSQNSVGENGGGMFGSGEVAARSLGCETQSTSRIMLGYVREETA